MITFENVSKRYPDGTEAVAELSLEAPDAAITVLVGPSGCGKTTTLRMTNRLVEPSGGRILIDGEDIRSRPVAQLRRGIGYVIQHAGLFPHRTVADNVATVPRLLGKDRRAARKRSMELMELVGLDLAFADRYPHQLSGGQQQRVGVARALAADPAILLMDEPFSAVDPIVRKSLQEQFLQIQAEVGKTILFVTHDIDEAIRIGDKIAVLRKGGHLAQFAAPRDLLEKPADAFVEEFLGLDRGVRRLTFISASGLSLHTDALVKQGVEPTAGQLEQPWLLLVDDAGTPIGWIDPRSPNAAPIPIGHPFIAGGDSLRAALDAAVLCPTGWAVGVDEQGHAVGVVSQEEIAVAIREAHRASLEAV
ncbi:MAG TPA: ATP-binding cassette domain-containing protein [Actinospica sp.]|nr:ATP-binding cassette domain-containing protein [Actinospica sp.]